ncbi:MAG: hypothetical protein RR646_01765 [Erysipelotrichaceae bacterium]
MNIKQKVSYFWKEFLAIRTNIEEALDNDNQDALKDIINDLNFELETITACQILVEKGEVGLYELCFDPGYNKSSQYICALICKFMPIALKSSWLVCPYLAPLTQRAKNTVIKLSNAEYQGSDFIIYYTIDDINKCLHIQVYSEALQKMNDNEKDEIVNRLLLLYVGQLELEARIASVEIIDVKSDNENAITLDNLFEEICDLIVDKDWVDYDDPTYIYFAYKLDQDVISDNIHEDIYLQTTSYPHLFEERNDKLHDIYDKFEKLGGEFGYIYYEHTQSKEEIAIFRRNLEKQFNSVAYDLGIARSIGGALGSKYCYIDIAVFDKYELLGLINKMNELLEFKISYISYKL